MKHEPRISIPPILLLLGLVLMPFEATHAKKTDCCKDKKTERLEVVLDLAAQDPGTEEIRPIPVGEDLSLRVVNMVVDSQAAYQISIDLIEVPEDSLPFPFPTAETPEDGSESRRIDCSAGFLESLQGLTTEDAVRAAVQAARNRHSSCANDPTLTRLIEEHTQRLFPIDALRRGNQVVATVTRLGTPSMTWKLTLETPSRGEWRFSYGFTFLPNRDKRFFTEQDAEDPSLFRIREQNDREDLDFLPSVIYHWHNPVARKNPWAPGFVAGLGWDLEEPALFLGAGWTVRENITVTVGAAIHRFSDLAGRYEVDQALMENLESSDLTERTYGANVYFGVAFRLQENIFRRRDDIIKERAQQRAAAAQQQAATQQQQERKEIDEKLVLAELNLCLKKAETAYATALETAGDNITETQKGKLEAQLAQDKAQCEKDTAQDQQNAQNEAAKEEARAQCLADADTALEAAKGACGKIDAGSKEDQDKCNTENSNDETKRQECLAKALQKAKDTCNTEAEEKAKAARVACVGGS